jgi:hypothetical protein
MSSVLGISDLTRPIMGDLLRVALYAARMHPIQDIRATILSACDTALDRIGAQRLTERNVRSALRTAEQSAINPMVTTAADIAVAARVWRASTAIGKNRVFLGSADAIGEGYGVILDVDTKATYCSRGARLERGNDTSAMNLAMLPRVDGLSPINAAHAAFLRTDPEHGVTILVSAFSERPLAMSMSSWIANRSRSGPASNLLSSVDRLGLSISLTADQSIQISPRTPEATIRLAAACSSRAILCLDEEGREQTALGSAVLILLAPNDEAPKSLAAELHSRTGPLADWLRISPLPLVPELDRYVRAAIGSWLAAGMP